MVLFISALMLIISFDTLLQAVEGRFRPLQSPKGAI
jgi:hypothetical protein